MRQQEGSKEHLRDAVNKIIDGKSEDAEINFRDYVSVKAREVVGDKNKHVSNEE